MTAIPPEFNLQSYYFELPEELIAQAPPAEHGASRLLVLDRATGATHEARFADIVEFLPPGALLVANNTKVLPARLMGRRASGGRVEFLLLTPLPLITVRDRKGGGHEAEAEGLVKMSKSVRVGETLHFPGMDILVLEKGDFGRIRGRLCWQGDLGAHFLSTGRIPLPPYIRRADDGQDRVRYQTVYAREDRLGSVAAPTAGLHFTPEILEALSRRGVVRAEVSLYVGYGTFSPVRVEDIREHAMHAEYVEVPERTARLIRQARNEGRPVVAVGTTTVRALESMAAGPDGIGPFAGWTDIFIRPGHRFKIVDQLVTNFHLPRSSLIIMVGTFAGRQKIIDAYRHAISRGFRFFSYGDAMFIR